MFETDTTPRAIELDAQKQPAGSARLQRPLAWSAAIVLWLACVAVAGLYSVNYDATPTAITHSSCEWPAESACSLSPNVPTLVMFVHPRCPCSRATMSELEILLTRAKGRLQTQLVFLVPAGKEAAWAHSSLWETAARLPGVTLHEDLGGVEHQRFGAQVSGEVFLFQPDGKLVFHGGITASRGHAGDNLGRSAIEAYLSGETIPTATTPAFGCELSQPAAG